MSDEAGDPDAESFPSARPERRPIRGAAIFVAGAAVAFLAWAMLFTGLPWQATAVGTVLVVGVATIVSRAGTRPRPRRRAGLERTQWPDAGMKLAVDALPDPCFITDARGRLRYANRAAASLGAIQPGDPLSFRLRTPSFLEALDRVATGGATERIAWAEKVPTDLWYEAHIAPIRIPGRAPEASGGPDFVLVMVRDLTEQRRVEKLRVDFVANASHELRTPLASLTGFIETLQGPARNDAAARERFLAIMAEQARRMKRLIDDLLNLSRIEMRSHIRPTVPVDLVEIAHQAADSLEPLAAELDVEIERALECGPLVVRGDRDELGQVFENLIENALKYGTEGKRVVIAGGREPGPDGRGQVFVTVRDFGVGIAAEHLPRLTERFYRIDNDASRARRGTGLGLAIVKHILGRHAARLGIDSRPGEGAAFTVRLDAADVPSVTRNDAGDEKKIKDLDLHKTTMPGS
ncbi:ATP-binding protein [Segnochrobactrum spirostomi]|uniref:histidine kinase n=1 Tax=Segnochrobactrum spirostomi TaxID=2608987 RepID=A0A6A7Y3T6_9HYPH|nr:ATP-binding protein [Segnochrobactrum spirostomi]MQT13037.1 PAS domain-containing protein [Segnochrobactrum spirostomi]